MPSESNDSKMKAGAGTNLARSYTQGKMETLAERNKSEMDLDLPIAIQSLKCGQASVKGARSRNEDCHGMREVGRYAFLYVCDGHGGPNLAKKMGESFDTIMQNKVKFLEPECSPQTMVAMMRECYEDAVKIAEAEKGGTTFTAGLLQLNTMIFASMQLGDSLVGALQLDEPQPGTLCDAEVIYYIDDARGCDSPPPPPGDCAFKHTITRTHSYTDPSEVERYRKVLKAHAGYTLRVDKRTDCHPLEDRCLADVVGCANVGLPEPSRTVQHHNSYSDVIFHKLQREPEFVVWQLPPHRVVCVFAVCDGFESKLAMPTVDRLAECLADPGKYLGDDKNFAGTVFEACNVVNFSADKWKKFSVKDKILEIRDKTTLPDREWQEAHESSCDAITGLLDRYDQKIPTLQEDPQAAIEAAVNTAVVLLSDDNVTAQVVVVEPAAK